LGFQSPWVSGKLHQCRAVFACQKPNSALI
jgi:hypothetical protein